MDQRGSVLIENLLAIALLGIWVLGLFALLAAISTAGSMAHQLGVASGLASQKLEEITASCEDPVEISREPLDPTRFPKHQWQVAVQDVGSALQRVTVTVLWPQRGRERRVSLTTLVPRRADQ